MFLKIHKSQTLTQGKVGDVCELGVNVSDEVSECVDTVSSSEN